MAHRDMNPSEPHDNQPSAGPRGAIETSVLVIGAGPYGVAVGLDLHLSGVAVQVCGEPFALWFNHTITNAALRSDVRTSEVYCRDGRYSLPGFLKRTLGNERAAQIVADRVPVAVFRDYLRDVVQRLPFDVRREQVRDLTRVGDRFHAVTDAGRTLIAEQVVLACGVGEYRHLPDFLRALETDRVIHGWNTQAYENLRGQRIMVVGRGQSAGEAIAELRSHNQVTWVYRSDVIYHADPIHLPKSLFELALLGSRVFAYLPSKLRNSLTKAFVGTTMTPDLKAHVESPDVQCVRRDAQSLDLTLRDGLIHSRSLSQDFDYLVACTGYKPGVDRIRFLSPQIRDAIARIGAMPLLNRHFETTVPGLFMVGGLAEPIHGPAQRFMVGARNATLAVCPVLVRRCRATAMAG